MVRQSSRQVRINRSSMENHKINKVKEEPHLSGAYIRNLVKHLTSIKTKPPFNSNKQVSLPESPPPPSPPQPPQPPYKKQVRRRHHTTKPYQERLLNMAEARREIATALKFHRASMQQQEQLPQTATNHSQLELSSTTTAAANENLTFTLPNQTLGLNLNLQDFSNLDTNFYHKPLSSYSMSSSLSSCSSSSSSNSSSAVMSEEAMVNSTINLHHAMDDDEMEKIRSLGEQHQMEWNDTMNLLKSARWFKFLNSTIDLEQEDEKFDLGFNVFGQVVEFPLW